MLRSIDRKLRSATRPTILLISIVLVGVVAALDHITGFELSFSIFYLIPIALTSWYVGRHTGQAISVISSIAWLSVDIASGHGYSAPLIPFWNALVRLGFFILVALLLASLRTHVRNEESLARMDGLTGVMTGRAFRYSAAEVIGLAARNRKPFVLVYVDLDDFKKVNDTRGHAEGDRALKTIASALTQSVRRTDIVGRLGGDEFAILLPETDETGTREVIDKIRANLSSATAAAGWPVGASIGAAMLPMPPHDPDEAIARADALMYQAKQAGKNRTVVIEVSPDPSRPPEIRGARPAP